MTKNNRTRFFSVTQKVKTAFASLYVHVDFDDRGPVKVHFSTPGKFYDTEMDAAIKSLASVTTEILKEARDEE